MLNTAMKSPSLSTLLFAVSLLAASQPALAATKKADARTADLVAALQAVSPDPLGGRLGLAAAATQVAPLSPVKVERSVVVQSQRASPDERAYLLWKRTQKS
jgi:hypothetical protein